MSRNTSPEARAAYFKEWYAKNHARKRASCHAWYRANATRICRDKQIQRYKLSEAEFDALVKSAEGRCAICDVMTPALDIDHCHTTGAVRGLVCRTCNNRVLAVLDSPLAEKALAYIARSKA